MTGHRSGRNTMELVGNCPHCSREIKVSKDSNKLTRCPYCDEVFSIAKNMRVSNVDRHYSQKKNPRANSASSNLPKSVSIVSVDIPFWPLVGFMMKWVIASLPALAFFIIFLFIMVRLVKNYAPSLF